MRSNAAEYAAAEEMTKKALPGSGAVADYGRSTVLGLQS
jgi:hypothetical protein